MSDHISIEALRKAANTYPATSSGMPPVEIQRSSLLALVEAVEALNDLVDGCDNRVPHDDGPAGLDEARDTRDRFDFDGGKTDASE